VTEVPPLAVPHDAAIGFCGKLPTRGDFVAAALPRRFVEPWHDWMQRALTASRDILGDDWLAAWLEAPVWRFVLSPGVCGPDAALGLWMPSVDRVGRHFPLTVAATVVDGDPTALLRAGGGFLAAAELAGRTALADDLAPDELAVRIAAAASAEPGDCGAGSPLFPTERALWWSEGSSRVAPGFFASRSLPNGVSFAGMLDAGPVASLADRRER
jgi:type VI secretion system protein ImpM